MSSIAYSLQTLGEYVPPKRTVWEPREAVAYFYDALHSLLGHPALPQTVALLTAQSALESARWKACWNNNPSNIKHGPKRAGAFTCIRLNEVIHGDVVWFDPDTPIEKDGPPTLVPPGHPQTRMRAYAAAYTGVIDKISFLSIGKWRSALDAALAGAASLYVHRIHALGYFTAPLEPYERGVVSLTKTYLPIARQESETPLELLEHEEQQLQRDIAACLRCDPSEWLDFVGVQIGDYLRDNLFRTRD